MEDVDSEDFLTFEPLEADDEESYPEYDTSRAGDKEWPKYEFPSGGKTLVIAHDQWGTLWSVHFKEGGELPESLKGKFTDEENARLAVQLYLASKE
jgi:hypothetical protein